MTLKGKLVAAQLPLLAALAFVSALSLSALGRLGAKSQEILKDNYRSVLAAQRITEAVERIDDAAALAALGGDRDAVRLRAGPAMAALEQELRVEEGNITEPGEARLARELRDRWEEAGGLLAGLEAADRRGAQALYLSRISPAFQRVRGAAAEILALNQDAMVRKSDRAQALSERLRGAALAAGASATALALLAAAALLRRSVLRPLQVVQQAVRRLGEGDLEIRAVVAGRDEIAELAQDFNAMAEHLRRYRQSSLGDLLRAQQAAQAAIDSLPEPVVVLGPKGEVLSSNRAAAELLGSAESLADFRPELREALRTVQEHVFGGRGARVPRGLDEAVRVPGPAGDRYLLPSANPLHDEDGLTIGATAVLQDVTRFKRFDELKDDMVSTVAHEFRTPLTSIRMAVHLCLEEVVGPLAPKQADLLAAAREDCERLQTLVDDLLDLSRLQSGATPMSPEPVPASALLGQALARHRDAAEARGVALLCRPHGEDPVVLADPERIALVFDNLITNALRYTPGGGSVALGFFWEKDRVRFEVVDTGPGIPAAQHGRIFERRYQVPGVEGGASGLGLSIAREILLAHGGEIGVASEPGLGSTFWFTLPEVRSG